MSLQVWLPLNGDLTQQGTANTTFSGTPAWKTYGKIGNAALNLQNRITCTTMALNGVQFFSITFWARIENNPDSTANWMDVIGFTDQTSGGSKGQFRFETGYGNTAYSGVHWHDNATNAIINGSYTYNTGTEFDKWHHIAVTISDTAICSYYDGMLKSTLTTNLNKGHLTGTWWLGESTTRGCIQDVRIYDHALSAAEVHEIAQGLVLHYKLDGFFGGAGENLVINGDARNGLTGWANWGTASSRQVITINNKKWFTFKTDANGKYGGFSQDRGIALYKPNTQYTISALMYASANASGRLWVHTRSTEGGANLAQYLTTVNVTTSPALYTFTFNTGSNASYTINKLNLMIGAVNTTSTLDFYISNIKVEEGTKATTWVPCKEEGGYDVTKVEDSSGYNHNGITNGNIQIVSNSSRYNNCIYSIDGSSNYIQTPTLNMPTDAVTLNIWFKSLNTTPTADYHMVVDSVGNSSGRQHYEMAIYKTGYFRGGLFVNGSRKADNCTTTTGCDGNWHMLTLSYDGTAVKRYFDGIMEKSTAVAITTGLQPTATLRLFKDGYSSYACREASLSDFRIYCTALDADAVRQLYEVGAKVDNKQNLHTFELVENNLKTEINKRGQLICNELNEDTATKLYKSGNLIETNEIIEF